MSPSARLPEREGGEQTVDGTLRLRGGCIPCPVRLFPCIVPPTTSRIDQGHVHADGCVGVGIMTLFIFFYSGMCADQLLVKRVGRLNVLHHPHPMLLLIERPTTNEPGTPQFTIWLMTSHRHRLRLLAFA